MFKQSKIWKFWTSLTQKLETLPAPDLNLFARLYIATVFFKSGRTKVTGEQGEGLWDSIISYITPSDSALFLFEEEYALPFISADVAAQLAILAETVLPLLLILGFATRLSAFALFIMTLIIQVFVYPGLWTEHVIWAVALLLLILRGGGRITLDCLFLKKYLPKTQ